MLMISGVVFGHELSLDGLVSRPTSQDFITAGQDKHSHGEEAWDDDLTALADA